MAWGAPESHSVLSGISPVKLYNNIASLLAVQSSHGTSTKPDYEAGRSSSFMVRERSWAKAAKAGPSAGIGITRCLLPEFFR